MYTQSEWIHEGRGVSYVYIHTEEEVMHPPYSDKRGSVLISAIFNARTRPAPTATPTRPAAKVGRKPPPMPSIRGRKTTRVAHSIFYFLAPFR